LVSTISVDDPFDAEQIEDVEIGVSGKLFQKTNLIDHKSQVLARMDYCMLPFHDQVCQRILIHQCGEHGHPKMAVDVLELMRRSMLPINAITYGVYHKAVMSGRWPSEPTERAILYWTLLRNTLDATIRLRRYEKARRATVQRYKAVITPPPLPTPQPPPKSDSKPNISASLSLTGSPSLSSLVHQIRKQTLKSKLFVHSVHTFA
jgi:pentatricopeptide repeat protein